MNIDLSKFLWAKKSSNSDEWLPLYVHLADTGNTMALIWDYWLPKAQQRFLIDNLFTIKDEGFEEKSEDEIDDEVVKKFCRFIGMVHDLGKATPVFQGKKSRYEENKIDEVLKERAYEFGFYNSKSDYINYENASKTHHALASDMLLIKQGIHKNIAVVCGAHHGYPPNIIDYVNYKIDVYPKNFGHSNNVWPNDVWIKAQKELFEFAKNTCKYNAIEDIPVPNQPAQVLLSGMLVMADWISSNEELFKYIGAYDSPIFSEESLIKRAIEAWKNINLTTHWQPNIEWLSGSLYSKRFNQILNFIPNPVQSKAEEIAVNIKKPGLIIIEAAMGQGKTEAALVCAEILAQKSGASGIFFALPTQATSDGIFPRIIDWLSNFNEENRSIRLAHGKAQFNKRYSNLAKIGSSKNLYEEDLDKKENKIFVHQWFEGGKKALLDHFVVGTIDQLLLAALKQKHFMLRHLGIAGKVVIIDECHAFDAYMNVYLKKALEWLGAYGVPVILLSATLSRQQRESLVMEYQKGNQFKKPNYLKDDKNFSYPLITYSDGNIIKEIAIEDKSSKKLVEVDMLEDTKLIDFLYRKLEQGGIVGIILNTVKRAQEVYGLISSVFKEEAVLLHSQFLAPHRAEKESELITELGKNYSNRPKLKIVIGTQIFEQSFNVDFDLLITELCPVDLLLQRIGRLHRFKLERQKKLKVPTCYILHPKDELWNSGTEKVYPKYLLESTKDILPKKINIPEDIPILVQKLYDDEFKFEKDREEYLFKIEGGERKASAFNIQPPLLDDVEYNIRSFLEHNGSLDEKIAEARVRDSDPSIEVILVKETKEEHLVFEYEGKNYSIIKNMILDDETAKALACQKIRLPRVLCAYGNLRKTIEYLEILNKDKFAYLQQYSWLKGELILPLNKDGVARINNWILYYDKNYGLRYKKEGVNE